MRRIRLLAVLCGIAWLAVSPARGDLTNRYKQIIRTSGLGQTQFSVMVMDLSTDEVLAQINADEPRMPASNMKLITTAAALHLLGPDFQFRTVLGLLEPTDPSQRPSLVMIGDGDPALGDPILLEKHGLSVEDLLNQWTQAVRDTGVKQFARLWVDDRVFDHQFIHPDWPEDQLHRDYCAQVAGINFYQNCVDVLLIPSPQAGQAAQVELFPPAPFLQTINRTITGKADLYWIDRQRSTNVLVLGGTVRNRPLSPTPVTIHDPPMFLGQLLAHRLAQQGITVEQVARPADEEVLPPAKPLHVAQTALPLVLARTNQDSQNMFAEALLKRMGRQVTGVSGGWNNGSAAVRIFLRDRLGPDSATIQIADGSGMSRNNRVTARLLVELLRIMHDDPDLRRAAAFRQSLAYSGKADDGQLTGVGTLEDRFDGLRPNQWVFGKSGYIRGVSCLSGYLVLPAQAGDPQPRTVAFSFLFNGFAPPIYNHQLKALQDKLVETIETDLVPAAQIGG